MIICLKTCSKQALVHHAEIHLSYRLPLQIISDCQLNCDYQVVSYPDYYVLNLKVSGLLSLRCLRCASEYVYPYYNQTEVAICSHDAVAEQQMSAYECIVSKHHAVDLTDIVTDELHLYVPEKHTELTDCHALDEFVRGNNQENAWLG